VEGGIPAPHAFTFALSNERVIPHNMRSSTTSFRDSSLSNVLLSRTRSFGHAARAGLALGAVTLLSAPTAFAEESAENKAAARDLAVDGIKLAQAGDCQAAIPKLKRAEKLYHAPTILTWIGECLLQQERYVEGTETLRRVIREKLEPNAPEAYAKAQAKAQQLIDGAKGKIAKLTLLVESEGKDLSGVEGLKVEVGDTVISNALVGAPRPTDPGQHTITVTAPGYATATETIQIEAGGKEELTIVLEYTGEGLAGAATKDDSTTGDNGETPEAGSGNLLAWSLIGGGAALLAGGGVTGFLAINKKGDLNCNEDNRCASDQQDTLDSANFQATLSTVLFGVGGAAAAAGVILLFTGESEAPSATVGGVEFEPLLGVASVGVGGHF